MSGISTRIKNKVEDVRLHLQHPHLHRTTDYTEPMVRVTPSSTIQVTANNSFSIWDQIFSDTMMMVVVIDRLVHHAIIIEINPVSNVNRTK